MDAIVEIRIKHTIATSRTINDQARNADSLIDTVPDRSQRWAGHVLCIYSAVYDNPRSVQRLDVRSDQVWTSVPVRIDPSSQAYERLPVPPDPLPLKFRAGSNVRTIDSASFELDGKHYRLKGAQMIDRTEICKDKSGHRYSCGLRAFKALDNILRGTFFECAVVGSQHDLELVQCSTNVQDIAQRLQRLPSD